MSSFSLWLFFSFLTPFLWAINNVLDRAWMTNLVKNEYAISLLAAFTRFPFFLILWWWTDWYVPPQREMFIAFLAGILNTLPYVFYFKSLRKADTAQTILVYDAVNPLGILLLSVLFFGEKLGLSEGTAFILLLAAGLLSALQWGEKIRFNRALDKAHFAQNWRSQIFRSFAASLCEARMALRAHFNPAAAWIILAAVLWAPSDVLMDYEVLRFPSVLSFLAWMHLGAFLSSLILWMFPVVRANARKQDFQWPRKAWIFFLIGTITVFLSYIAFVNALALGRVSLTIVLTNNQPIFVFLFELLLCRFFSVFEKPDLRFRSLFPKAISLFLIFLGVWLLSAS